ncbi:hypothetical protein M9980_04500 [Sphingomonas donggukensis]|uniref:Uncharacterized protein n=1 Tax=Sphingomonas donggukensis TaxID=2949093 RepID=A0ABY4U1R0_9SPHN|nr:hypothetical protein [Sphingomonas donggukensis]URW76483.1 hypothetical protein M9980_04500 [Sphingomonas donggukensis]
MSDLPFRPFADDAAVRRVGERLLARTLPRPEWTHEAHLAACLYLLTERPDIDVDARIGDTIRTYNASVGGVNDDTQGYHDTITHASVAGVRAFLKTQPSGGLADRVNALLGSATGRRDWLLRFYSPERLFSVAARRAFVPPDLAPLP